MQQSELKSLRNLLACSLFPVIQKLSSEEITGIKKEKMKKKKRRENKTSSQQFLKYKYFGFAPFPLWMS